TATRDNNGRRHTRSALTRRDWRIVFDALVVGVAVAAKLRGNPVHGVAIALRALPPIAKLRQAFERGLVAFEIETSNSDRDRIVRRLTCSSARAATTLPTCALSAALLRKQHQTRGRHRDRHHANPSSYLHDPPSRGRWSVPQS